MILGGKIHSTASPQEPFSTDSKGGAGPIEKTK
ncbi:hypothetical protein Fuma_06591 [Fuerstiella marisgermanici]|uniref:Uncharacterized protein n=1 Tax=Fuerstiella marisgermanici TaxID=1891926 RepID=A0A1P8WS82_9PLAN|nr:hypothetical protein Fuma_06591 [Fuerstiella marisgermanici]